MRRRDTLLCCRLPSLPQAGTHLTHHLDCGALTLEPLDGGGGGGAGHHDRGRDAQLPGGVGGRHARIARCQGRGVESISAGRPGSPTSSL